jgi:hypothetical protein
LGPSSPLGIPASAREEAAMNTGRSLFAQLIEHLPAHEFAKCVRHYGGNKRVRSFSCWDQLLCMVFAQLTGRQSLRDIVACLRSMGTGLYHQGIRGNVARSTLADANESRDWRIYADLAQVLIAEARRLYAGEDLGVTGLKLSQAVFALDSTTIDLCMGLFPWALYKRKQHAVKLHTLLDLRGSIPTFIRISAAKGHDVNVLDDPELILQPGAFYAIDRGYLDFARLRRFTDVGAFFVTRARKNFRYRRVRSRPLSKADRAAGVTCDQLVKLVWFYPAKAYPGELRRIRYHDRERHKKLVFLTNNFVLPARSIADLYRLRWRVELFFKWIKQHLRIKAFYGTSANALKTQVWTAMIAYLLVAIVRKRLDVPMDLYTMLQVLSVMPFEKTPLLQAFPQGPGDLEESEIHKQLRLFDF